MNSVQVEILMVCPCSGGGGGNPILVIAIFAGAWLLFKWIKTLMKSKGVSFMKKAMKIIVVIALIVIVGIVFAVKQKNKASVSPVAAAPDNKPQNLEIPNSVETAGNLPRLVDLGAGKCIPCKMMAPILEEVKKEYAGIFDVEFIDVWENPDAGEKYNIRMIPTQIFFDAAGKELFRHEAFFSKEDILAKWKELGVQ
jgi:thioredoxin 1